MYCFNRKIRFLLPVLLLCACLAPLRAQGDTPAALLWIPGQSSDLKTELQALALCENCRISIALPPEKLPQPLLQMIKTEISKGKLELVLRAAGDPPLPLLFSPDNPEVQWPGKPKSGLWASRLDILASVMFQALSRHQELHGDAPRGFAPAGGASIPQMVEPLAAYEMHWLAAGPSPKEPYAVLYSSGVLLLPFHAVYSAQQLQELLDSASLAAENRQSAPSETQKFIDGNDSLPEPSVLVDTPPLPAVESAQQPKPQPVLFAVVDDSLPNASSVQRPLLAELMAFKYDKHEPQWLTVSTAALAASSSALNASDYPKPWCGDYRPWTGAIKQRAALYTLGELRRAINISANSRTGGHIGAQLVSGLSDLERGDRLLLFTSTDTAVALRAEEEFKQKVAGLYRQAKLTIPPSLRGSLTMSEFPAEAEQQASTDTVTVSAGDAYIIFNNPLKALAIPPQYKTLPGGTDPQQLFNIQALVVDWDERSLRFRIRNRRLSRQERPLLSQLLIADIYIDINHRRNSGTVNFLPGRRLSANPEDSWEYALNIAGGKAQVYKTSLSGTQAGKSYPTRLDSSGDLIAEIPRSEFRGNPKLWGYSALVMASQNESADKLPAQLETGETVIDTIAADKLGSTLTALRVPDKD